MLPIIVNQNQYGVDQICCPFSRMHSTQCTVMIKMVPKIKTLHMYCFHDLHTKLQSFWCSICNISFCSCQTKTRQSMHQLECGSCTIIVHHTYFQLKSETSVETLDCQEKVNPFAASLPSAAWGQQQIQDCHLNRWSRIKKKSFTLLKRLILG